MIVLAASPGSSLLLRVLLGLFALGLLSWLLWRALAKSYDPLGLLFRLTVTAGVLVGGYFSINSMAGDGTAPGQIAGLLVSLVFGLILAIIWVPVLINRVSEAIGGVFTGGNEPPPPQPYYSVAETRVKQGKYREAVQEVLRQLEQFPTDITGHLKLAEIQAKHLNDLPAAQLTIERFCLQPDHAPVHLACALNTMADWHLKAQDPDAARLALEKIIELLPNSDQANAAAQRIAHLASKETLLSAREHRPVTLRPGIADLGLRDDTAALRRVEETPAETAQRLVQHLENHPLDNEAREKLALIYADYYQRTDLAIRQLEELIAAPNQPGKEVARWLNTIADLQIKEGATLAEVRATLERIVQLFPGLAAAELATQRIEYLGLELKGKTATEAIKLGTYEKDLGLKRDKGK